jgi:hypothetical protein
MNQNARRQQHVAGRRPETHRSQETTKASASQTFLLAATGWNTEQMETLLKNCEAEMKAYRYALDEQYSVNADAVIAVIRVDNCAGRKQRSTRGISSQIWQGISRRAGARFECVKHSERPARRAGRDALRLLLCADEGMKTERLYCGLRA